MLHVLPASVVPWLNRRTRRPGLPSIADIAIETGFTDQSHLTRVFRRSLGETPAAFRRRFRHD